MFAALVFLTLVQSTTPALALDDGWAHDLKTPSDKVFSTPMHILFETEWSLDTNGNSIAVFERDSEERPRAILVTTSIKKKINPAIAVMQEHFTFESVPGGVKVTKYKVRWKCRKGDKQSWQTKKEICSVS